MAELEDRVSELERIIPAILAELGSLTMQLVHLSNELDETKERTSILLNNMAQNALENRRRIVALETRMTDLLSE